MVAEAYLTICGDQTCNMNCSMLPLLTGKVPVECTNGGNWRISTSARRNSQLKSTIRGKATLPIKAGRVAVGLSVRPTSTFTSGSPPRPPSAKLSGQWPFVNISSIQIVKRPRFVAVACVLHWPQLLTLVEFCVFIKSRSRLSTIVRSRIIVRMNGLLQIFFDEKN